MKIAVCDDNKTYADEIKRHTENFLQSTGAKFEIDLYYNSQSIYDSSNIYDMVFLDIEMQPYSGIQVAKKLKELNTHIIIFMITSYNKYLDDAMDLNVFRYIQKPLDAARLKAGLEKALKSIDDAEITFYLKSGGTAKSLTSNDIVYIEIVGRTTKVVTINCEYLSENKIDFWKEKLIASFFYRVHKSFIINMKYITDYQRDTVTLRKKYKVPIAYRKQAEFRKAFLSFVGGR